MAEIDFSKYQSTDQIYDDIVSIKIQGATNVAIATFEGVKLHLRNAALPGDTEQFIIELKAVADRLANARPNEPLAKNGVKYILNMLRINNPGLSRVEDAKDLLIGLADEYLGMISQGKQDIIASGQAVMSEVDAVMTHCHSSTVEKLIASRYASFPSLQVVCTETRPLYQGRITAKHLVEQGIDTTLIVDGAAESYVIGKGGINPDVIFIGCDQISINGDLLNKIGSWGLALAAYYANKPIYVVGSILKTDVSTAYTKVSIEERNAAELWDGAPEGLKMSNPAFELVPHELITGFITEHGVLKPEEISKCIQTNYQWLF